MIDNLNIILPLLEFDSEDDFYYLQLLRRKKDNPELGSNAQVMKNYYIRSQQHLQDRWEEIKKLCNFFNARASIRLNKRSFERVAFKTLSNVANTLGNKEFYHVRNSYDRACGQVHHDKNKTWIIDIDDVSDYSEAEWTLYMRELGEAIDSCEPLGEDKVKAVIPSATGVHIITRPFNLLKFKTVYNYNLDIHKDNPTNLYIP